MTPRQEQVPGLAAFLHATGRDRAVRSVAGAVRRRVDRVGGKGGPAQLRQGVVVTVQSGTQGTLLSAPLLSVRMDGDATTGIVVDDVISVCPVLPHIGDMVWCLQSGGLLLAVASNRITQSDSVAYSMTAVSSVNVTVTYFAPFTAKPSVVAMPENSAGVRLNAFLLSHTVSGGLYVGCVIRVQQNENVAVTTASIVAYTAVGLVIG
jgi:hypothetical protein